MTIDDKLKDERIIELLKLAVMHGMCPQLILNEYQTEQRYRFHRWIDGQEHSNIIGLADAFKKTDEEAYSTILNKYFRVK